MRSTAVAILRVITSYSIHYTKLYDASEQVQHGENVDISLVVENVGQVPGEEVYFSTPVKVKRESDASYNFV